MSPLTFELSVFHKTALRPVIELVLKTGKIPFVVSQTQCHAN
jgi:hypothetical protein